MDEKRSEFLTTMIAILGRLRDTAVKHEEQLLASMLDVARGEAEDTLRHANDLEELAARRNERSSVHSWRACDRWPDEGVRTNADAPRADDDETEHIAA